MMQSEVLDLTNEQPAEDRLITLPTQEVTPRVTSARETGDSTEEKAPLERDREWWRGTIALILMGLLTVVVVATFVYIIWLSAGFEDMSIDNLITMIQTVGTTLLMPLVGLIGAVVGFYYGGQTATQAASQTTQTAAEAASQTRETVSQMQPPGSQGNRGSE